MSMQSTLPRRIAFHPLSCAELSVVRDVLGQDDRFRLSHIGPWIAALATSIQRRPYIEKQAADAAAAPDDWHVRTPPIFVVGFWRSGTTLLHEMLAADRAFASPRLMDILFPADAAYLIWYKKKAIGAIARIKTDDSGAPIRPTRMVDLVEVALHRPQEEELALCHLGAPSFYRASFFPKQRAAHIDEALFPTEGSEARDSWRAAHSRFLKTLVAKYPGLQILLKNPANSTRIDDLLELYPDARFIRIDRDPKSVIPSFVRMMDLSLAQFSLQGQAKPYPREEAEALHARVIAKLDADWEKIAPERRAEVRYEDLVADPIKVVKGIYEALDLDLSAAAALRRKKRWENRVRHWTPEREKRGKTVSPKSGEDVSR